MTTNSPQTGLATAIESLDGDPGPSNRGTPSSSTSPNIRNSAVRKKAIQSLHASLRISSKQRAATVHTLRAGEKVWSASENSTTSSSEDKGSKQPPLQAPAVTEALTKSTKENVAIGTTSSDRKQRKGEEGKGTEKSKDDYYHENTEDRRRRHRSLKRFPTAPSNLDLLVPEKKTSEALPKGPPAVPPLSLSLPAQKDASPRSSVKANKSTPSKRHESTITSPTSTRRKDTSSTRRDTITSPTSRREASSSLSSSKHRDRALSPPSSGHSSRATHRRSTTTSSLYTDMSTEKLTNQLKIALYSPQDDEGSRKLKRGSTRSISANRRRPTIILEVALTGAGDAPGSSRRSRSQPRGSVAPPPSMSVKTELKR